MESTLHDMLGKLGVHKRLADVLQRLVGHLDLIQIGAEAAVVLLVGLLGYVLSTHAPRSSRGITASLGYAATACRRIHHHATFLAGGTLAGAADGAGAGLQGGAD